MDDESAVGREMVQYPPADITSDEFEAFVTELFQATADQLEELTVTPHEKIVASDGTYDFDATVRFDWAGLSFLVLVEAKRHKDPIKRELVAVLHQKIHSVGANKGVMISTSPYQRGALQFAKQHGIALATVTEGRFTIEAKAAVKPPVMSREEAREYGLETFVGHVYSEGSEPGSTNVTLLSPRYPEYVAEHLLSLPSQR